MNSTALGMGDGWEANIARLIDEANQTLSKSTSSSSHRANYRRKKNAISSVDLGLREGYRSSTVDPRAAFATDSSVSSPRQRTTDYSSSSPLTRPSSFRGDRGASYHLNDNMSAWDIPQNLGGLARPASSSRARSPPRATTPPTPPLSRFAESRVNDARIEAMEDRIKLELHTVVRRDVGCESSDREMFRFVTMLGVCVPRRCRPWLKKTCIYLKKSQ